jgi:hypothetical protein
VVFKSFRVEVGGEDALPDGTSFCGLSSMFSIIIMGIAVQSCGVSILYNGFVAI